MSRTATVLSAAALGAATPAAAGQLIVQFDLPRVPVAEYHKPYVAIWIQREDGSAAGTAALWYDTEREEHGRRYLKELTQWWRKAGREMTFPADGVSGATRAPGPQRIAFDTAKGPFATLAPGAYQLVVETAREQGGHEAVKAPLAWPAKPGVVEQAKRETEVGAVRLSVR